MSAPLIEFAGIEKAFFGVKVLKGVSLTVPRGGALALVGENGAGKSTLMNILGGNLQPESGAMRFDAEEYAPANPQDAARRGIAFIHQELNLFPNLTIAENLFLTSFPRLGISPFIHGREIRRRTADLLREVGLDVPPDRSVATLSAGERQLVEIAKALSVDARLIIFDEPTTSLSLRESERLFELIARLRARGLTMIYISHTLSEVFRLCDDVVVLRDGEVVGSGSTNGFTTEKLVSLMVGRTMSQLFPKRRTPARLGEGDKHAGSETGTPILEVRNVSRLGVIEGISFTLHGGEVLGMFGLMGAGRSELARILFGLDRRTSGEVRLNGELLPHLKPGELIERGMAFLTENRRSEGLCLDGAVGENLTLPSLGQYRHPRWRWLSSDLLAAAVNRIRGVVHLDAKTRDTQPVRTLSGGNQQKVVLGKWLLREPRVLILDEPTRGVDVGARFQIYQLIHDLADRGAGVFVISSEMEELIGLCDRILVLRSGQLVDELVRPEFNRERILRTALHAGSALEAAP